MLNINNLYKKYKKNIVLNNLNLSIEKSKIYALVGVNGAGKSTLLEIICGVRKYQSGEVFIDGININDIKKRNSIKRKIGYMPQLFGMFNDLTVKENLKYLCCIYNIPNEKEVIEKILNLCNLKQKENYVSKTLSGGYKQFLSLAASIIHSPQILILDEPTSAMDPIFRTQFWKIIHTLNDNGTTILVTTHYMEEINECDKLVLLSNGKIIHSTEVNNMFENNKYTNVEQLIKDYINKDENETEN